MLSAGTYFERRCLNCQGSVAFGSGHMFDRNIRVEAVCGGRGSGGVFRCYVLRSVAVGLYSKRYGTCTVPSVIVGIAALELALRERSCTLE